jgi:pilus assembly protein CpaB
MPMPNRRIITLVIALILGGVAVVVTRLYISDILQEAKARERRERQALLENQVPVVVAAVDIPAQTAIESQMLSAGVFPREYVQPQAVQAADSVAGMVTLVAIAKGEQITMNKISVQQQRPKDIASLTPAGKRGFPVEVDNIKDLEGLLNPGDYVDVIAVLAVPQEGQGVKQTILPVLQNVPVLAVGKETSARAAAKSSSRDKQSSVVTLALSAKEAGIISFLQEQGKIRLSVRSADDTVIETVEPVTWSEVYEYLPALKPQEQKQVKSIEVFRAGKKEALALTE